MSTDKIPYTLPRRSRWEMFSRREVEAWPHYRLRADVSNRALCSWQDEHKSGRWVYVLEYNSYAIDDPMLASDFVLRFGE